jgi:hypothetical protein
MADTEYDDSILETSEDLGTVEWDNIEGTGTPAEGTHLCLVKKVLGHQYNFKSYTGPRAKVMLQIIDGPDKGKLIYDYITLPDSHESQGSQNRRALIGTRMGLFPKGSKETRNVKWKTLEGLQVLITGDHNQSPDKKWAEQNPTAPAKMLTFFNVKFDGWQDPAVAAAGAPPAGAAVGAAAGAAKRQDYGDI